MAKNVSVTARLTTQPTTTSRKFVSYSINSQSVYILLEKIVFHRTSTGLFWAKYLIPAVWHETSKWRNSVAKKLERKRPVENLSPCHYVKYFKGAILRRADIRNELNSLKFMRHGVYTDEIALWQSMPLASIFSSRNPVLFFRLQADDGANHHQVLFDHSRGATQRRRHLQVLQSSSGKSLALRRTIAT